MIIINTTYHASDNIKEIFINWIKEIYIPTALQHEELSEPQLCRIITGNENEGETPISRKRYGFFVSLV